MDEKPLTKLDPEAVSKKAQKLFESLKERIKGQDQALKCIVRAKERAESPLRDASRPIAAFLELGPSGVGKTATPRALADWLFKNPDGLTYITSSNPISSQWDIEQYHHEYLAKKHGKEIDRLFERGGALFEENAKLKELLKEIKAFRKNITALKKRKAKGLAVKQRKISKLMDSYLKKAIDHVKNSKKLAQDFQEAERLGWIYDPENPPKNLVSIILFDEIEKADESLHNYLLEVMDRGCANGISFKNSFIFMTSNVGSEEIAQQLGAHMGFHKEVVQHPENLDETIDKVATEAVKKIFAPEFRGRLDKIIVFRPLREENLREILELLLRDLHNDLVKRECPLAIKLDQPAKDYIIKQSTKHPELGARLLKNRLTEHVKDKLVNLLGNGQLSPGDTVAVKLQGEELMFYKE